MELNSGGCRDHFETKLVREQAPGKDGKKRRARNKNERSDRGWGPFLEAPGNYRAR